VRAPEQLVALSEDTRGQPPQGQGTTTPAHLFDWQESSRTMRVAGFSSQSLTLTGRGEPQQLIGTMSIGGMLDLLGVQPLFGRLPGPADEDAGAPGTIVLSYETWRELFGDDRGAVGQTLTLNGTARTIIGVMPPGYTFLGGPSEFYAPARFDPEFRTNRDQYFILAVGRLRDGATLEQARVEMETIATRLRRDWPTFDADLAIGVAPLQEVIVGSTRPQLLVLMGAVVFVLLITCANLSNLLLARATARRREIAVRQALGAGRSRVARQLLTESVLLAMAGGLAGVLVGKAFLSLLLAAQALTNLPRVDEITLDGRVLAFTFVVSLVAGVLFGSIPAWQLSRRDASDVLREGARGSSGGNWARSTLVVSELALAVMLLAGAGLLLRSFERLRQVDPGVRVDGLLTFSVRIPQRDVTFFPRSIERIRQLPGVRSASLSSMIPVSGRGVGAWFNRIDRPLAPGTTPRSSVYRVVTPDYFGTAGIRLVSGRLLEDTDRLDAPAIVVNEALVREYYPDEDPLGKPVYLGAPDNRLFDNGRIVGVVTDTRDAGLRSDPFPTVYMPLAVMPGWPQFYYVVRTAGDPAMLIEPARAAIRAMNPDLPVRNVATMREVLDEAVAPARWSTTLLGAFAGVALVIAVIGVFGVLSFIVTQRTRELGIRLALGADASDLRRMVVARGLALAASGVVLGVGGALALTRFMQSLLYGVEPTDPATLIAVSAALLVSALAASYLPARRATRVDPMLALRAE
jgi:putative ABC transport system permease protein